MDFALCTDQSSKPSLRTSLRRFCASFPKLLNNGSRPGRLLEQSSEESLSALLRGSLFMSFPFRSEQIEGVEKILVAAPAPYHGPKNSEPDERPFHRQRTVAPSMRASLAFSLDNRDYDFGEFAPRSFELRESNRTWCHPSKPMLPPSNLISKSNVRKMGPSRVWPSSAQQRMGEGSLSDTSNSN